MIWEAIKTLAQSAGMGLAVLFFIALVVCSIAPLFERRNDTRRNLSEGPALGRNGGGRHNVAPANLHAPFHGGDNAGA